jgi:hypothetical protein
MFSVLGIGSFRSSAQPARIRVLVNSEEVAFDVPPVEVGGRLLVPLRGVFERLGASVVWEPSTQRIVATAGSKVIELVVGRRDGAVDGKPVLLDVPPMVVQGRTMVPLRFVSETLGAYVQWQASARTVLITVAVAGPPPPGYQRTPTPAAPATPAPAPAPVPAATPTAPGTRVTEGILVAVNATSTPPRIQVAVGNVIHVFQITRDTTISRVDAASGSGGSAALTALRVGDQARVEAAGTSPEALSVRATYRLVRGRVDVMTTANIALQDGQVLRINGDAAAILNGATLALTDAPARIRRGDEVVLRLNPASGEVWEIVATSPSAAAPTATPTAARAAGTLTFEAINDAPLVEAAPAAVHPSEVLLVGRDGSGRFRSVVRFTVTLPPGTVVRRATLRLFMYAIRSGGTDLYSVFPVRRRWNERNATWSGIAAEYDSARRSGPVTIAAGTTRRHFEWTVTEIVRDWTTGAVASNGLLIRNLELIPNLLYFGHREDVPANRPVLIVEYGPP